MVSCTGETAQYIFNKMMTNPCSKMLKYVLDDKFGMLKEKGSEDETKGDVWQVPWTNQKGRIKTINGYPELFSTLNATFKIQNLRRIIKLKKQHFQTSYFYALTSM